MTTARLRAVRTQRPDAGMTLVELMVGMVLTSVIGVLSLTFFVGSTKQADRVGEQSQNAAAVRVAAEQIASALRLADTPTARPGFSAGRFEVTNVDRVVFYANLDRTSRSGTANRTPPTRVEILVDSAGALRQNLYRPKSTTYPTNYADNYPTTPSTSALLLRTVVLPATVFQYCSAVTDPTTTGCTTATTAASIASVGITLTVSGRAGTTPQKVMTTVAITGAVS